MITDIKYYSEDFEEISKLLEAYKGNIQFIEKGAIHDFSKEKITYGFNNIFRSFPYEIETSSHDIGYSIHTIELFDLFYEISDYDGKIETKRIEQSKARFKNKTLDPQDIYLISDFIEDYFHSLTYNYGDYLKNAKDLHFFAEIENEEVILYNLLNLYRRILADDLKQISIFWGVSLTKQISDKILKMLCDFIEQRILVLNPETGMDSLTNKLTFKSNNLKRIQWLGTQQELCELIYELNKKGWIPDIVDGERKKIADSITELFDLEKTKRKPSSSIKDSFYQQFKGELIDGERIYSFRDSKKYEKKFDKINKNH